MNTQLKNNIINQLGYDELNQECLELLADVARYGAQCGFSGFIYYTETVQFFKDNKSDIIELVKVQADDMGENLIDFIQSFRCLDATEDEIGETIWSDDADTFVANALSWFALESLAYELEG